MSKTRYPRRKRNPASANLTDAYREPVAFRGRPDAEHPVGTNPNRGKRHLSTLGHAEPRESFGDRKRRKVAEKTVTRHRAIRPRAHRSVAFVAAELHRTSDAVRYADAA